jgi:hypothetical protein
MSRIRNLLLAFIFALVFSDSASSMYDPHLGRFCSKDPIGYGDGANRYAYCGDSPVVRRDSLGLQSGPPTLKEIIDSLGDLPPIAVPPIGMPSTTTPFFPPGIFSPPQPLTCLQFLRGLNVGKYHYDLGDDPFFRKAVECNVFFYCGACGGPGNQAHPSNPPSICLGGPQGIHPPHDWISIVLHEVTHIQQLIDDGQCACSSKKSSIRPPQAPAVADCETCKQWEEAAYRRQAQYLFPLDSAMQNEWVKAGVCDSCSSRCKRGEFPVPCPQYPNPDDYFPI